MRIAPVAEVKACLSEYLRRCQEGPIVVTKNGRPAALLVAVPEEEEELERFLLYHTPRFRRLLETASERIRSHGGLTDAEVWHGGSGKEKGRPSPKRKKRSS
jgi:prevent-host-death family protein